MDISNIVLELTSRINNERNLDNTEAVFALENFLEWLQESTQE